jgi:uncharacterized protein YjbI with pentapeptide repeats
MNILKEYVYGVISELNRYKRETGKDLDLTREDPKTGEVIHYGHSADSLSFYDKKGYFVHFGKVPKAGLQFNNTSPDTPIGFYVYPLDKEKIAKFAINRRYAMIVKPKQSANILDMGSYDESSYKSDVRKLSSIGFDRKLEDAVKKDGKGNSAASLLWQVTRRLACSPERRYLSGLPHGTDNNFRDQDVKTWTNIFTNVLNYDGVTDPGMGVIYEGEPAQSVFFRMNQIQLVDVIDTFNVDRKVTSVDRLFTRDKSPRLTSKEFSKRNIEKLDFTNRRKEIQVNNVVINRGDFFGVVGPVKYAFNDSTMTNCDFSESERLNWTFNRCNLQNSDFSKLGGLGVNVLSFNESNVDGVSFSGSTLKLSLTGCSFDFVDLSDSTVVNGKIDKVDGLKVNNTTFDSCVFIADFSGVDLRGATFVRCDFSRSTNVNLDDLKVS